MIRFSIYRGVFRGIDLRIFEYFFLNALLFILTEWDFEIRVVLFGFKIEFEIKLTHDW